MSDALENKAVEILDKSQAAVAAFSDKLVEMAKQYGPDVAAAALQMARIDAASELIPAVVCLAASVIWGPSIIRKLIKADAEDIYDNPFALLALAAVGIIGGTMNLAAIVTVLNIWRWIGIFEPKLWLAKKILGL